MQPPCLGGVLDVVTPTPTLGEMLDAAPTTSGVMLDVVPPVSRGDAGCSPPISGDDAGCSPIPVPLLQLNLWRYGDFRADDADEFGYSR